MIENIDWIFFDIGSTLTDESDAYALRIKEMAEKSGVSISECARMVKNYFSAGKNGFLETARTLGVALPPWNSEAEKAYPDAKNCLETLSSRYKIGIIANQNVGLEERLEKFGFLKYLSVIASSAEEGFSKPDLRLFEIALKKANTIPSRSVMVGDRADNDIAPAKSLGMKTVLLRRTGNLYANARTERESPDFSAKDLDEVTRLIFAR